MFIDSHAHVYSEQFLNENAELFARALEVGVQTILMPAIDTQTHKYMLDLESIAPVHCLSMMGLHPCSVKADYEEELMVVENYLKQRPFIAIGESGLDFYWDLTYKEQQYEAFEKQIAWALEYQIPIVIHSRNATKECIEVVSKYKEYGLAGVFHCFSGSVEEAQAIMGLGFFLGIGGVLTFKKSGLDDVMREVGIKNVILETDAPYLAPVPYRGKRNEPAYIPLIANKLADVMELPVATIAEVTTNNAKNLFRL